jgi:hypothetical protein
MSMSINSATSFVNRTTSTASARNPAEREAVRDLTQALRASDLPAARQAYASILKNAPEGATFPKGSSFADLGKALVKGDMPAAQDAFKDMVRARLEGGPVVQLPPVADAQQAGGASDKSINLLA